MPEENELQEGTGALEAEAPSKTALKKQMTALQKMGEELVGLSDRELAKIPVDDENLSRAIDEARRIRSRSARRRQLQYIGKLMRSADSEPIRAALDALHQQKRQDANRFHALEQLRDDLLAGDTKALEDLLQSSPTADRQHLRQLVRQHQKDTRAATGEDSRTATPASRKLFRYLRELTDTSAD